MLVSIIFDDLLRPLADRQEGSDFKFYCVMILEVHDILPLKTIDKAIHQPKGD